VAQAAQRVARVIAPQSRQGRPIMGRADPAK
jgi:hypothetical protein